MPSKPLHLGLIFSLQYFCFVSPFPFSVLRFFLEYQWLIDFAVYAMGIYLFTEGYFCVVDPAMEVHIGAIWCVLTVLCCLYPSVHPL